MVGNNIVSSNISSLHILKCLRNGGNKVADESLSVSEPKDDTGNENNQESQGKEFVK